VEYKPSTTCKIIMACVALHNMATKARLPQPDVIAEDPEHPEVP